MAAWWALGKVGSGHVRASVGKMAEATIFGTWKAENGAVSARCRCLEVVEAFLAVSHAGKSVAVLPGGDPAFPFRTSIPSFR